MNKIIYADHAATTPVRKEVLEEMLPFFSENFGNASSLYSLGRKSKDVIDIARNRVAHAIGANSREIFFTSSGTEADNWAIKGVAFANKGKGNHIITSSIEHHAVLNTCKHLETQGFKVTYLPVDSRGIISLDNLEKAITDKTILISLMLANNEIGTIQPIKEISTFARQKGIYFHTDAVQAIGSIPVNVDELGVDLLTLSGHKFYGPKGIGALYIRKGTKISPLIQGGAQEKGKRSGTENVPGIVGLGKAIEIAVNNLSENSMYIKVLRDRLVNAILNEIPYSILNGDLDKRLPGNANFSFDYAETQPLLAALDIQGICVSSGSACTSGTFEKSHVLVAMGLPSEAVNCSIRITLGEENTEEDVNKIIEVLCETVKKVRDVSPLYKEIHNVKSLV